MRLLRLLRTGVAVACASTLVATPLVVPTAASAGQAESAAIQSMTIKVAKSAITLRGARGLHAGRVRIEVRGTGLAEVAMFDRGYDYADFRKDVAGAFTGNMKALRRAIANTQILGGVAPGESGTVMLPRAGRYTVFAFGNRGPGPHTSFTVGAAKRSPTPDVDGRIVAKSGPKWAGSNHLPAKGTLLFKNADRTVPHFMILQQVKEGTTTDQVLEALQSEEQGPPPDFVLPGSLETGSLSPGRRMTVDYDLPPGQYVIMCFFPDPRMDGMPHALMGMLKMIHLM